MGTGSTTTAILSISRPPGWDRIRADLFFRAEQFHLVPFPVTEEVGFSRETIVFTFALPKSIFHVFEIRPCISGESKRIGG